MTRGDHITPNTKSGCEVLRPRLDLLLLWSCLGLMFWMPSAVAGDDLPGLATLARAQKDEYVRLRDTLLKDRDSEWNLELALKQSWDAGLTAFILNQRFAARDRFVELDKKKARVYRSGYYSFDGYPTTISRDTVLAFLLERMWKNIPSEGESSCAYKTLARSRKPAVWNSALWRAMWEQSDDDRFRHVAVYHVCADPDPSVQRIILDVLQDEQSETAKRLRSRCFAGLGYRDTEETVDAMLDSVAIFEKEGSLDDAVWVFSHNSSPRARTFIHEFILNPENNETHRGEAVSKLCNLPHPSDEEIIRRFLASPVSVRVKRNALLSIASHCPIDHILPAIREVLISSDDPELIAYAALALNGAYGRAKKVDEAAKAEDAALLESVLEKRDDLSSATRVHMDMYIRGMRAKPGDPRVKLPDRPSDK